MQDQSAGIQSPVRESDAERRLKLAVAHALAGLIALSLWAAADAWRVVTGLALADLLSVLVAIPVGVVLATLVHEWFHLLGAWFGGSAYRVPARLGLYVFDYDYRANGPEKFALMSWAGQVGSALAVLILWFALPMDSGGRVMLVCAALGSALFSAQVEWPVILNAGRGADPLAELSRIDRALLTRSGVVSIAVTLGLWLVAS